MAERVGVYPGTFDPITLGHLDIIRRASKVVDRLIVAVAENDGKQPLFDTDRRVAMALQDTEEMREKGACIEIRPFHCLLIHFAQELGAQVLIRGLRAVSDFEYEFQMASMNSRLDPDIETLFLTASERQQFISSRFVKEIGRLGGDISSFVSPNVAQQLIAELRG
jgi:pantetheine-phosphate adenylyltransferase